MVKTYSRVRRAALLALILLVTGGLAPALRANPLTVGVLTTSRLFWHVPRLSGTSAPPRITAAVFDPLTTGLVLAGPGNSGDTMQRSTDGGATWEPLTSWAPRDERFPFRVAYGQAARTFLAYGAAGVYWTDDGGESWSQLPYQSLCGQIFELTASPADPQLLYAGTTSGFARSTDGGANWNLPGIGTYGCLEGPRAHTVASSATRPQVVYAGLYDNYGGGVQRSEDYGATWQDVSADLPFQGLGGGAKVSIIELAVDPRDDSVVWALAEDGRLFRTTDSGGDWTWLRDGIGDTRIASFTLVPQHDHRVYALSALRVYTREDGAPAWQAAELETIPQLSTFPGRISIAVDPADEHRIVVTGDDGIFVTLEERGVVHAPFVTR